MERDDSGGLDQTVAAGTEDEAGATVGETAETRAAGTAAATGAASSPADRARPFARPLDRYRLGALLGKGGMGEVRSATDRQIGRQVAVKRLPPAASPEAVARFLREARVQARLDHPAVVPVHELAVDEDGQPFFVMKRLSGVTLADVLSRLAATDADADAADTARQFPRQRLLRAFVEVCLAVEFAHTRGVIHRDLKPANITLGEFGEVYVLDWGIARVAAASTTAPPSPAAADPAPESDFADVDSIDGASTLAGAILGTPGYMPPEQVHGQADLDGRADVYALGCILFEILALEPLLPRGRAGLTAALAGPDARPSVRAPDREVPPELDALCARATQQDPADRFPSPRALGDAVQKFLDGDRDSELRAQLARAELAAAQDALAQGSGPAGRQRALRAAARALALDPTHRETAALVGRLMLEPPAEIPPEVHRAMEAHDIDALDASRRLVLFSSLGYVCFVPMLLWVGFRDPWYLITLIVLAGVMMGSAARLRSGIAVGRLALAGNALLIALVSWLTTPFMVAPGLAGMTAMAVATHPRIARPWLVATGLIAAILAPWALGQAGLASASISVAGGTMMFHTTAAHLHPVAVMLGLSTFVIVLVTMSVVIGRAQTEARRDAQRRLQIHAWQLGQLVPPAPVAD